MKPELIIATCSVLIALSALGVSFWQGYLQYKHQKLSVIPHMIIEFDRRYDSDVKVILRSNGLGPALLTDYKWIVNEKDFPLRNSQDHSSLQAHLGLSEYDFEFYCPDTGKFIEQGYETELFLFPDTANQESHEVISSKLSQTTVYLEFESIYGEKWSEFYPLKYA